MDACMDGWMCVWMCVWIDAWMDGRTGGWMSVWIHGWVSYSTHVQPSNVYTIRCLTKPDVVTSRPPTSGPCYSAWAKSCQKTRVSLVYCPRYSYLKPSLHYTM